MSWGEGVRKITSLPAAVVGLSRRGLLRAGYAADLVCFDPEKIIDRATFEDPMQPPEGVVHVMINGQWAVRDGVINTDPSVLALRPDACNGLTRTGQT